MATKPGPQVPDLWQCVCGCFNFRFRKRCYRCDQPK